MSKSVDFEFGVPSERKRFLRRHSNYFEQLPNLQKALKDVFNQKGPRNPVDRLIPSLCENCIGAFDALTILCANGYGHAALKLLAEMFESFVLVRSIHLHPHRAHDFLHLLSLISEPSVDRKREDSPSHRDDSNFLRSYLETKSRLSRWSDNFFEEHLHSAGLSDELMYVFHFSLKYALPSITQIRTSIAERETNGAEEKHQPPPNSADVAFTAGYHLAIQVLLLLIDHLNLEKSKPLYKRALDDYQYSFDESSATFRILPRRSPIKSVRTRQLDTEDYREKSLKLIRENPIVEDSKYEVGVSLQELTNLYLLESISGFGPQKFKELYTLHVPLHEVIENPNYLLKFGKRGEAFQSDLLEIRSTRYEECRYRAIYQISTALRNNAKIITYSHPAYPPNVFESNNAMPALYVRGSLDVLAWNKVVACVGSRNIRPPYSSRLQEFARDASFDQFTIASGFALGADTIGHETALRSGGGTICVMPCGLERPFPPENKGLWNDLLNYGRVAFVSEFPFGVRTSSLTLRKRNKLIVAFSLGVLIAQSSVKGGAMNAYRFARDQRKPVATFAGDGSEDTSGNDLICKEQRIEDSVFTLTNDSQAYRGWLLGLYSLI